MVSGYSDHQIIQSSGSEFFKSGKYDGGVGYRPRRGRRGGGRVKSRTRLINMINTGIVEGVSVCPITIYLSSVNLEKNHNAFLKNNAKIYDIPPTLSPPTPPHPTFGGAYRVVAKEKVKPAYELSGPSGRRLSLEQRTIRKMTEITAYFALITRHLQQCIRHVDGVPNR